MKAKAPNPHKVTARRATAAVHSSPTYTNHCLGLGRTYTVLVILVVVGIIGLISFNFQPIVRAVTLATMRQPEGYTELSFTQSKAHPLPASAPVGQPERFTFRVTNHESKRFTYPYIVTLSVGGTTTQVAGGAFTSENGDSKDTAVTFVMPSSGKTGIITVEITSLHQLIYFRSYS